MLFRQKCKGVGRGWSRKGRELPRHKQWEPFRKHRGYPGSQTNWGLGMCCRLNQLYSGEPKNAPDGEEDMQPDHRAVKAGGAEKRRGLQEANKTSHRFCCNYIQASTQRKLGDIYSECEKMKLAQDTAAPLKKQKKTNIFLQFAIAFSKQMTLISAL